MCLMSVENSGFSCLYVHTHYLSHYSNLSSSEHHFLLQTGYALRSHYNVHLISEEFYRKTT